MFMIKSWTILKHPLKYPFIMGCRRLVNKYPQRTEKKKNDILSAAVKLFKRCPPNKAGIRDIAAEAGVSQVTIYNHYRNKDNLILEVVKKVVRTHVEALNEIAESRKSFHEKIQSIIFEQTQMISGFHPDFINILITNPKIVKYLSETYEEKLMNMFMQIIEQGKLEGYVNPELPDSLIISVIQLFNRDITSKESLLLSNHNIADIQMKVFEILIYGISGKNFEHKP